MVDKVLKKAREGLPALLDLLEKDLRAVGFIGTHKILRLLKKLRLEVEKEHPDSE